MEAEIEELPRVPKPINGRFLSIENLKFYLDYYIQKNSAKEKIPIVLEHISQTDNHKGLFLWFVDPSITMQEIYYHLRRKVEAQQVQTGKKLSQNERILIFFKKEKGFILKQPMKTVQEKYQKLKEKEGFLWLYFQFPPLFPSTTLVWSDLIFLPIIAPVIPVIGALLIYDWTSRKLETVSMSSLKMPTFGSAAHKFEYKAAFSLQERKKKWQVFHSNYPGQIAIVVQKHQRSLLPALPFLKFSVSPLTLYSNLVQMLLTRIRKSTGPEYEKFSIFIAINSKIPKASATMGEVYQKHKDKDGMLYVTYQEQESF